MRLSLARAALGAAAAAAAITGASGRASADGARITLRWTAPSACPTREAVAAEVDRILGDAGARPPAPLEVSAEVTGGEGAYRVHIETGAAPNTRARTLQGRSCAAIADAAALVIALVIDPNATPKEKPAGAEPPPVPDGAAENSHEGEKTGRISSAPAPGPAAVPPSAAAPPPKAPSVAPRAKSEATPASSRLPFSVRVSARAAGDAGSLPGVGAGFAGDVALHVAWARVELGAAIFPARNAVVTTSTAPNSPIVADTTAGGAVGLWAITAGACGAFPLQRFELGPCVGGEVGRISASGFGVTHPSAGAATWGAARFGALASWFPFTDSPASRVGLTLHVDALAPFTRPTFVLENVGAGAVHKPSDVAGRLSGGLEARF